jgi:electron transport complex protein RnfC
LKKYKRTSFGRGLAINEHKEATTKTPAQPVPRPAQVVIPLNQNAGAPNQPLVKVGDTVKKGQRIGFVADPKMMGVPTHASIAGVVKKIEPRMVSNNTLGMCVVIEVAPAGADEETDYMQPLDPFACTREEALQRCRDAGLVGMGGAGFPTYIKLNPPPTAKVDVIIADAAECEPYLTTDEAAISDKTDKIIRGLSITMKITGVKHGIIGMEDNKAFLCDKVEAAIEKSQDIKSLGASVEIKLCRTRYPQGGEKLLIKALTGREVPSGGLPANAGCVVQNVGTLIAEADAFDLGIPLIERGLTVSGGACGNPKNIIAPIGTVISDLPQDFFNIQEDEVCKILSGGPMMGMAVSTCEFPIQKNTSGILFLTKAETARYTEGPCIRCARCAGKCSARLYPMAMNNALAAGKVEEAVNLGLMDCMECGACSYICPSRIRLTQRFRIGKAQWKQILADRKAAAAKVAANLKAAAEANKAAAPREAAK